MFCKRAFVTLYSFFKRKNVIVSGDMRYFFIAHFNKMVHCLYSTTEVVDGDRTDVLVIVCSVEEYQRGVFGDHAIVLISFGIHGNRRNYSFYLRPQKSF